MSNTRQAQRCPRPASDSAQTLSHVMLPQDANPRGHVHGGVIMQYIDNAAAVVAMRHSRHMCVTAAIDRIDFHAPVFVGNLLTLRASINAVGRSSMEIGVRVEAEDPLQDSVRHIASAYLTFVALDEQGTPVPVPPLCIENPEQHRRLDDARRRREALQRYRRGED